MPKPKIDFSLIVFLVLPQKLRLQRLIAREQQLYGDRVKNGGDMENTHIEFINWTKDYENPENNESNTLNCHNKIVTSALCPTISITTPMETSAQINIILKQLIF